VKGDRRHFRRVLNKLARLQAIRDYHLFRDYLYIARWWRCP
jgi:hypothetical protein